MSETLAAVLFDLDGTLVDSNELHVQAWEQAFREAGHAISPSAIRGQIGKGADMLVPSLIPGAEDDLAQALGDRHGAIFKERYLPQVRAFPRARDILGRVHESGRKVVLASSASQEELDHYLDLLDASALVAAGTSIDDVERSKPAPDIFAAALKKADVGAAEAVAVGDTPYDIAAAGGCSLATVAVRSGGFPDESLAGAVAVYDDVAQLLAGFERSPLAS